jgi:hypothetical protein
MSRKLALLIATFIVAALGLVVIRGVLAQDPDPALQLSEQTPLPYVPPLGYEDVTPGPTFTPIRPPPSSGAISEERAIELARARTSPDSPIVSVQLTTAGDTNRLQLWDPDYPVWLITISGEFRPNYWKCCEPMPLYERMTLVIDGIDGKVLGTQLRGRIDN